MAQYYYDKFTSIENKLYNDDAPWTNSSATIGSFSSYAKSYSFDRTNNKYILGPKWGYDGGPVNIGSIVYSLSGNFLSRHSAKEATYDPTVTVPVNSIYKDATKNTFSITDYNKGSLVQSNIAAEDGTYPANGRHTDGYWYVKGAAVVGTPGTVVNLPQGTSNAGARKLIRLANGTYVAATIGPDVINFWKSVNDGVAWELLYSITGPNLADVAIASYGNEVKALVGYSNVMRLYRIQINGAATYKDISSDNTSPIRSISLAVDQTNGDLHATWAAIFNPYPNTTNIRYSKSTNGGDTWSTVEILTTANSVDYYFKNPSIVVRNSVPIIVCEAKGTFYNNDVVSSNANSRSINCFRFVGGVWKKNFVIFSNGNDGLAQEMPTLVVGVDGTLHLAWSGRDVLATANNQILYKTSTDGGATWSETQKLTLSTLYGRYAPSLTVDKENTVIIEFQTMIDGSVYKVAQLKNLRGGGWVGLTVAAEAGFTSVLQPQTLYDPTFNGRFGDSPPTIYMISGSRVMFFGTYSINQKPSITLTSPTNDQTLYENDTINISGDAYDADKDQSVTVFYQINGEQRKVLATNVSQTQITLSKQLTFKGGKLYDGETVLTGMLAAGVAHTLKVWAVDTENGQSATIERTFYVIPNRAPLLSVDAVVPAGVIDSDKFKISGTASDQDANSNIKVNYRINGANPVEVYNGAGGAWEFEVSLAQLVVNENRIIIEVIDNYDAKTSKTIKLNKNELKTPILQSVARYKISPPKGSARGVLIWVQRDEELDLKVELSMTLVGEQEQYVLLEADPDKIVPVTDGIVEDEYYHETVEPKDNIILKLTTTRPNISIDNKVYLIMGVVE